MSNEYIHTPAERPSRNIAFSDEWEFLLDLFDERTNILIKYSRLEELLSNLTSTLRQSQSKPSRIFASLDAQMEERITNARALVDQIQQHKTLVNSQKNKMMHLTNKIKSTDATEAQCIKSAAAIKMANKMLYLLPLFILLAALAYFLS